MKRSVSTHGQCPAYRPRLGLLDVIGKSGFGFPFQIGMLVAGYLIFVQTSSAQNSPYSRLLGVLPLGLLGLFAYAAISSAWYLRRFHPRLMQPYDSPLIFGMAFLGTLFSLYLTFLELFVIRAVCLWCLSSAVLITLLMLISLKPARASLSRIDWQTLPL